MNIKQSYLAHGLEYLLILKTEKETTVGNILDLSQSKYAKGLTNSEVYLSLFHVYKHHQGPITIWRIKN